MNLRQLDALCSILVAADPWPIKQEQKEALQELATEAAKKHGFADWFDAYNRADRKIRFLEARDRLEYALSYWEGVRSTEAHSELCTARDELEKIYDLR